MKKVLLAVSLGVLCIMWNPAKCADPNYCEPTTSGNPKSNRSIKNKPSNNDTVIQMSPLLENNQHNAYQHTLGQSRSSTPRPRNSAPRPRNDPLLNQLKNVFYAHPLLYSVVMFFFIGGFCFFFIIPSQRTISAVIPSIPEYPIPHYDIDVINRYTTRGSTEYDVSFKNLSKRLLDDPNRIAIRKNEEPAEHFKKILESVIEKMNIQNKDKIKKVLYNALADKTKFEKIVKNYTEKERNRKMLTDDDYILKALIICHRAYSDLAAKSSQIFNGDFYYLDRSAIGSFSETITISGGGSLLGRTTSQFSNMLYEMTSDNVYNEVFRNQNHSFKQRFKDLMKIRIRYNYMDTDCMVVPKFMAKFQEHYMNVNKYTAILVHQLLSRSDRIKHLVWVGVL